MTSASRQALGAAAPRSPSLEQGQRREHERGDGKARRNESQRRQLADVFLNDERDPPDDGVVSSSRRRLDGSGRRLAVVRGKPQTCSISVSMPTKSLGCRNSTGLPCAPIFGSPSPSTRAPAAFSGRAQR